MTKKPSSRRKKSISSAISDSELPFKRANSDISSQENVDSAAISVEVVEIEELSKKEESDRNLLERKVERAFFEAGKALMELRDRKLYRSSHRTFEDYCRDRFGHSRQKSNYLIAAADIYENLTTICCQNSGIDDLTTNSSQILPTSEGQVRSMTKLEPQQQSEMWQTAVEVAGGKVPSGRVVKNVVEQIMERTQVPNTYQLGEVCQILAKDNPELRGKGGCWAIVSEVNEFSCTVRVWDGEYTVGLQYLKSFNYLPAECEQMRQVCDRITQVYSDSLEETVKNLLQLLGKVNRPYLTVVEEKLLSVLESEYSNGIKV